MNTLRRRTDDITTSTPISEGVAEPTRMQPLPQPELSDLISPRWRQSVNLQLEEISKFGAGWDGFSGGAIRRDVLNYTCQILEEIMFPNTPAPNITPMSHEGIMIEWHEHAIDLEIEIETPGQLWVSFEDSRDAISEEYSLRSDLRRVEGPIQKLTKRAAVIQN